MLTTVAPAKINWTLEVLGRRADGYHEVRTVMQAIDLHDELRLEPPADGAALVTGSGVPATDDLIVRALDAGQGLGLGSASIVVSKRIPAGSGLGGGSSDAAATLRLMAHGQQANISEKKVAEAAASIGSDVPFFLHGGTAVAEGRGERVTPLADIPATWIVLLVPPLTLPDKTRRMYRALEQGDLSDGTATAVLTERFREGGGPDGALLVNAFERAAYEVFPALAKYREWMLDAGVQAVHLSGAGPALFALTSGEAEARAIRARMTRPKMGERVHAIRTIGAAESTLTWDS